MDKEQDRRIRVASIQMKMDDGGKAANLRRAAALIDGVDGADLILLPEIWNVGYFAFDAYRAESETLSGPTVSMLREKASAKGCFLFGGSIVEEDGGEYYNTSVLIDRQGAIAGSYRKIHLFGHQSEEARLLTQGHAPTVVETELGTFGLSTCYDLRFPELYRRMAVSGAEVFLVASAWPYPRLEAWLLFNRVRALENQVFLVSSNCAGANRGKGFVGHSMVADPWGTPLAAAGDGERIVRAEIDAAQVQAARSVFTSFHDRVLID